MVPRWGDRKRRRAAGRVHPPDPFREGVADQPPQPNDEVDEWGYESFPASDPPQH